MRNPMDDEIWGDLADQYVMLGRIEEAKQAYRRAMRLDPEDSEWRGALGGLGEVVEGMPLSGMPDDEALGDRADALRVSGRWEEACELYAQAAALDPADTEWTQWIATCQVAPGGGARFDGEGVEALEGRLHGDLALLLALGRAHARAGDVEQAEIYLRGALLLSPGHAEALRTYLAITGRDARSVLTELADEGAAAGAAGALGDHLLGLGDRDGARKAWTRAAEAAPEDARWAARLELLELRARAEGGAE
jgi:tetratricopeptide (TPR) repeat protein